MSSSLSVLIKEGIVTCSNDEHSLKAYSPIEVTEEGIVIWVNDEHPEKVLRPIEVTEEGIVICVNDELFENIFYDELFGYLQLFQEF